MPEYVMPGKTLPSFKALPSFLQGYIEAAFFTWPEDELTADGEEPGFADLSAESLAKAAAECAAFTEAHAADLEACGLDDTQAGRDFWYTRNGHGVGYWDRKAESPEAAAALERLSEAAQKLGDTWGGYIGDDGKAYL